MVRLRVADEACEEALRILPAMQEGTCSTSVYVLQPPRLHGAVLAAVGAGVRARPEVLGVCGANPDLTPRIPSVVPPEPRERPGAQ